MTRARNLASVAGTSYVTASDGNIGIGTTVPTSKLNVVGVVSATSFYGQSATFTSNVSIASSVNIVGSLSLANANSSGIITSTGINVGSAVTITSSGINVNSGSLNVGSGGINVTGIITATDFNATSDRNLKENIKIVIDPIEKISKINGVEFSWKSSKAQSIGVIAQELEEIFPELVTQNDSHKTVNYNGLIGVLIEAVKEQQKQINSLKEHIEKLDR